MFFLSLPVVTIRYATILRNYIVTLPYYYSIIILLLTTILQPFLGLYIKISSSRITQILLVYNTTS